MKIRTIIVDDEELARRGLRALSQRCGDLELICECRNGLEAVEAIHQHRPDLVFLDVQMPGKTGFDVIGAIADDQRPHVVFVTAYDQFALRAFEVHALDYLLKPVVDRLPIKANDGRIIVVRLADIDWIEADGDYVSVHVGGKTWLMRETIAAVELRLALSGFVRIHRSALVNAERVKELRPRDKGEYTVVLTNGTELKLTRNYRASVERLVGATL